MTSLILATTNRDKVREIRQLLAHPQVTLYSLGDLPPVVEADETGLTFEDNARLKALHYDARLAGAIGDPHVLTVAEDSGLEIDALAGEPGVLSARFLRPDAPYTERFAYILQRLRDASVSRATARFVCAMAVARAGRLVFEARGTIEGVIADEPRGTNGFGYDPLFFYPPYGRTLAEVSETDKLRVAHRGHACRQLATWLAQVMGNGITVTGDSASRGDEPAPRTAPRTSTPN